MDKRSAEQVPPARAYSLVRLGDELSTVINRVRRAFGSIPMWGVAARPQVEQAEQALEQVAGQLLGGEVDGAAWDQALQEYECTWMVLLDELRGADQRRCAA